jgi:hypothetical protein
MAASVRITWNDAEFRRITEVQTVPQAVWRAAGKVRDRAKMNITSAGLVDTGALRSSIVARRMRGGKAGVWYEVGSDLPYSIFQHEGTRSPIVPRRAKVLRFTPKGGGAFVFAKQVRGVTGTPYLTDALRSLTNADFGS